MDARTLKAIRITAPSLYNSRWYFAKLVTSKDYVTYHKGKLHSVLKDEEFCWSEYLTTAFLGYESEAQVVIDLPDVEDE